MTRSKSFTKLKYNSLENISGGNSEVKNRPESIQIGLICASFGAAAAAVTSAASCAIYRKKSDTAMKLGNNEKAKKYDSVMSGLAVASVCFASAAPLIYLMAD